MRKLSLAEPVTALRPIPIHDNGEPLVDFTDVCPRLLLDRPRFNYRRETLLRETVANMICKADSLLPPGYRLAVVEVHIPALRERKEDIPVLTEAFLAARQPPRKLTKTFQLAALAALASTAPARARTRNAEARS